MPEKLERKLKIVCKKRGYSKKRCNAYVYGTMRKRGWKPKRKKESLNSKINKLKI